MLSKLRERLGAKVVAIGTVFALLGGGVAAAATGTLPDTAQEAVAQVAAGLGFAIPAGGGDSDESADTEVTSTEETAQAETTEVADNGEGDIGHPMDNGEGVPQEVKDFFVDLRTWVGCVQEHARAHGEQQSNPDTRVEDDEFTDEEKTELCGEKPTNPNDSDEELEEAAEVLEISLDDLDGNDIPGEGVPQEVRDYLTALWGWVGCIQDGARAHGEQQSNADTRVEDDEYDEADKLALCGEKPTNPNDDGEEAEVEGEGRPADAAPPAWAGGPPPWAGGSEGRP